MAHRKPLGTHCTLTYDTSEEVAVGDVVATQTRAEVSSCYRVVAARKVRHREPRPLQGWKLECVRIGAEEIEEDDKVHPLHWYPRDLKRRKA